MKAQLEILKKSAQKIASQYKNKNLAQFIPRRTEDYINKIINLEDQSENSLKIEMNKLEDFLKISERQIYFQNLHHKEDSVLDDKN